MAILRRGGSERHRRERSDRGGWSEGEASPFIISNVFYHDGFFSYIRTASDIHRKRKFGFFDSLLFLLKYFASQERLPDYWPLL